MLTSGLTTFIAGLLSLALIIWRYHDLELGCETVVVVVVTALSLLAVLIGLVMLLAGLIILGCES